MSEKFESLPIQEVSPSDELYWSKPELWVRAAIGAESNRGASEIDDAELAERYNEGGFAEWDPRVAQAVLGYLRSVGYIDLRST